MAEGVRAARSARSRAGLRARPVAAAQSVRAAVQDGDSRWCPARSSRLAAVAARSPCPHITVVAASGRSPRSGSLGEAAQLDLARAGKVPAGVIAGLADVHHECCPRSLDRPDQRGCCGQLPAVGGPGGDAAGQFAGDRGVADRSARATGSRPDPGRGCADHDRDVRRRASQPSQVANWGRSGIDTEPGCGRRRSRPPAARPRLSAPSASSRRTASRHQRRQAVGAAGTSGPWRLSSPSRAK